MTGKSHRDSMDSKETTIHDDRKIAQRQSQQVLYFSSALESESYLVFSKKRENLFEAAKA